VRILRILRKVFGSVDIFNRSFAPPFLLFNCIFLYNISNAIPLAPSLHLTNSAVRVRHIVCVRVSE
jgi:hypothetical protein